MKINLTLLAAIFTLISFASKAQNLIQNGSFEKHGDQKCLECNTLYGQYPGLMYNWDNNGWGCQLRDKDYKLFPDDNKRLGNPFDKMSPKDGKAMIEMWYSPICGGKKYMCATYLTARTTQTMRVGELYEASFWIYIESTKRADPDWAKHLGIVVLPQNITYRIAGGGKRLIIPYMPIDTVIYDAWYQVKWRIRPLCTSNYFTIGLFGDEDWPASKRFEDVSYFVDMVSLIELPSQSAVADSSIYYCSRYDPKTLGVSPKMDNEILLFQNKSFDLSPEHKAALDSFVVYAKANPDMVFELSGHTDSIGSGNLELSQNRAQSVFKYLTEEKQLPVFRFIVLSKGSKEPFRLNSTEEGRKLNRRVEVRQTGLKIANMFYRLALNAVEAGNYPEAFSYLNKWLIKYEDGGKIVLLFDPRFKVLNKDKRWEFLTKKIRDSYNEFKYPGYSFQLDSMLLDVRSITGELTMGYQNGLNALPGYVPELDTLLLELPISSDAVINQKYAEQFAALKPILAKTGWPKKSEFGDSASDAAFWMLFYSKDMVESLKWLPVLQKTCEEGEAPWINYAMLYDRCNRGLGKPQRYGTVVHGLEGGGLLVEPWEGTVDSINEYRAKIGLQGLSFKVVDAMEKQD